MAREDNFGERLKLAIKRAGLTQRKVSEELHISKDTITNYIKGRTKPSAAQAAKLAKFLNVDLQWLLTGTGSDPGGNTSREDFKKRLTQLISATGYTPSDLALQIGLNGAEFDDILKGKIPDPFTLCRIARALNTSVEWLLTGKHPYLPAVSTKRELRGPPRFDPSDVLRMARLMAYIARLDKNTLEKIMKDESTLHQIAKAYLIENRPAEPLRAAESPTTYKPDDVDRSGRSRKEGKRKNR